ncbi:hypothetical protein MSG28_003014 [Choristoneura fumiferana]|uniref:Uncharacterized protein n=1 Tax=Choristoneura fumiferana TaxID=7141 RepID=A0ACC0JKH2_CHOFU|nr:hypothetical protein MSG28_003014 [Choristoneura fumiferana]
MDRALRRDGVSGGARAPDLADDWSHAQVMTSDDAQSTIDKLTKVHGQWQLFLNDDDGHLNAWNNYIAISTLYSDGAGDQTMVIQARTKVEARGQGVTWLSWVIRPARVRPDSQAASTARGDISIMPRLSTIN